MKARPLRIGIILIVIIAFLGFFFVQSKKAPTMDKTAIANDLIKGTEEILKSEPNNFEFGMEKKFEDKLFVIYSFEKNETKYLGYGVYKEIKPQKYSRESIGNYQYIDESICFGTEALKLKSKDITIAFSKNSSDKTIYKVININGKDFTVEFEKGYSIKQIN